MAISRWPLGWQMVRSQSLDQLFAIRNPWWWRGILHTFAERARWEGGLLSYVALDTYVFSTIDIKASNFVLGRGDDCDIRLRLMEVSRNQAEIVFDENDPQKVWFIHMPAPDLRCRRPSFQRTRSPWLIANQSSDQSLWKTETWFPFWIARLNLVILQLYVLLVYCALVES